MFPGPSTSGMIYGTAWKESNTISSVIEAARAGYRAFDTAAQPRNYREDLVGEAIRIAIAQGMFARAEIYVSHTSLTLNIN